MFSSMTSADAYLALSVRTDGEPPRWLGLIDRRRPVDDDARVSHLRLENRPRLVPLAPGTYAIDHFDYSDSIAGDNRTIRIAGQPGFELRDDSVLHLGDLLISNGRINLLIDWQTIDRLCQMEPDLLADLPLVIGAEGDTARTLSAPCENVNL